LRHSCARERGCKYAKGRTVGSYLGCPHFPREDLVICPGQKEARELGGGPTGGASSEATGASLSCELPDHLQTKGMEKLS